MWVDIDDVRAELELLYRKTEEMLAEEENEGLRAMHMGTLIGYAKVEIMLNELEENYQEKEEEYSRNLMEEQQ